MHEEHPQPGVGHNRAEQVPIVPLPVTCPPFPAKSISLDMGGVSKESLDCWSFEGLNSQIYNSLRG